MIPKAQCQDGFDNDGDGLVDFPQDPGCSSKQDNDEFNFSCPFNCSSSSSSPMSSSSSSSSAPAPQCRDGIDNDGDGATDTSDFSCGGNPDDNDETNPKAACQDGSDNDGDGLVDFPQDPGCTSKQDNDEWNGPATVTLSKSDGRSTANAGDTLTYTITATNASQIPATNVTVTDVLPSDLQFLSASDGGSVNGQVVQWSNLSVAPGATRNLTVTTQIRQSAQQGTVIRNVAFTGNQTAEDLTTIQASVSSVGCIDILNETFNTAGNPIPTTAQFTYTLDGGQTAKNDATGIAHFVNVPAGTHTVSQMPDSAWTNLSVTPVGGIVQVTGGPCVAVVFKNRQNVIPPAQQSSSAPYVPQVYYPDPYANSSSTGNTSAMCKTLIDKYGDDIFSYTKKSKKNKKSKSSSALIKLLDKCL
jgi:uncharacterized repeat protein (TIGR01451 family)